MNLLHAALLLYVNALPSRSLSIPYQSPSLNTVRNNRHPRKKSPSSTRQRKRDESIKKQEVLRLKDQIFELASVTQRGFKSKAEERTEMNRCIDDLTRLNPTLEPASAYYSVTARQLHFSLQNAKNSISKFSKSRKLPVAPKQASLEGKWTMIYTDEPDVLSLSDTPTAKVGRIGQECTPFPDYTIKNVIEWKRPDWAGAIPFAGTSESRILQKVAIKAQASPKQPFNVTLSQSNFGLELLSPSNFDSGSKTTSKLNLITEEGLVALNPFQPLKVSLQLAGLRDQSMDDKFGTEYDIIPSIKIPKKETKSNNGDGGLNLITDDGLVALNPLQPLKVGFQIAGLDLDKALKNNGASTGLNKEEENEINLFDMAKVVLESGLVAGLLQLAPIRLGETDNAFTSSPSTIGNSQKQPLQQQQQKIIYLDENIIIYKTPKNHVTINKRDCEENQECWF